MREEAALRIRPYLTAFFTVSLAILLRALAVAGGLWTATTYFDFLIALIISLLIILGISKAPSNSQPIALVATVVISFLCVIVTHHYYVSGSAFSTYTASIVSLYTYVKLTKLIWVSHGVMQARKEFNFRKANDGSDSE